MTKKENYTFNVRRYNSITCEDNFYSVQSFEIIKDMIVSVFEKFCI